MPSQRCREGHDDWYVKPDGSRYCRTCNRDRIQAAAAARVRPPSPRLTAAWKEAYRRGIAAQLCDRIVQERDVPPALVWLYVNATRLERRQRVMTYKERRVLYLLSFGWSQPDAAKFLRISLHTVKDLVHNLEVALGVTTTAEAVAVAFRRGEIT